MPVEVRIEGLPELATRIRGAVSRLEADVREATLDAAAAGIMAEQQDHPYQDRRIPGKSHDEGGAIGLTDTAHAEQPRAGSQRAGFEAEMVWPAPYAGFVNKGTSKSRAYSFTPIAETTAGLVLGNQVERALATFRRAMGGS